ncbi:mitochondrial glycerol-3-phosphate dehydrogenase, partial [Kappamyces sp. JEL0680]
TSSRSTKLIHGGVRYLEKAFLELDYDQYKLVREALHERGTFMKIAPYLAYEIPIMLPLKQWWKMPYYFVGAKVYDLLAGSKGLSQSYFLTKTRALEAFPMLQREKISGAIVYYDGAHNDSRMNVAIALTAVQHGATVVNHVEVTELIRKPRETFLGKLGFGEQELCGAVCRDVLTGETWTVYAKGIINATDSIRKMDSGVETKEIVAPSAGVHVILPSYFSPKDMGLIDPNTSDGRVIFFLPWQGSVIAGTTDSPTSVQPNPIPGDDDINWILKEVCCFPLTQDIKLRRQDVQAAWSGIRPLVRDPAAKNTESLVRNHMINVSPSGLLTIAGGKWTTYRCMAEETIDKAIETTLLIGSQHWSENMFIKLIQHFGLETDVAKHLAESYGDKAWTVASLTAETGSRWPLFGKKLAAGYPYIEAEVRYACRREYACTAVDVIGRRTRLSYLNARACLEALPRVIDIMAEELGWDSKRKAKEAQDAQVFLLSMGLTIKEQSQFPVYSLVGDDSALFIPGEIDEFHRIFNSLDKEKSGKMLVRDLGKAFSSLGIKLKQDELNRMLQEVDLLQRPDVEFNDFLEILAAVKDSRSRKKFAKAVAKLEEREQFDTVTSGGGTAYAASGYLIQNNKNNGVELATATSGLLFGAMAPRALRLRAPAPIVLATAGLIGTAYYGKKLYEQEYGV